MSIRLGIDIGAVGVKAALVLPRERVEVILSRESSRQFLRPLQTGAPEDSAVLIADTRRTRGRPLDVTRDLLTEIRNCISPAEIKSLVLTGSGAPLVAEVLGVPTCNEFQACARAIDLLHHHVRTVFEIGGETSRYIRLEPDPASRTLGILDYSMNGDCAAGTGAFLDQQAVRLQFAVEEIGTIVEKAERAAQIAGRCSVFAKSDMIHAQQKGYAPPEVLRGLCNAVARNFKSAIVKGRTPQPPIILVGGVSANTAVVGALREAFELNENDLFVPEAADALGAVGAALSGAERSQTLGLTAQLERLNAASEGNGYVFPTAPPLSMERVTLLNTEVRPYEFPKDQPVVDAYLGLDIGSVGTKLVLIDEQGGVIFSIFTRTEGRPIDRKSVV